MIEYLTFLSNASNLLPSLNIRNNVPIFLKGKVSLVVQPQKISLKTYIIWTY